MSIRHKAVQGYKWNLASAILAVVLQCLQVYYTAKFLSPEDFGVWGVVVLLTGFALIFNDVGIGGAIIHHQEMPSKHLSSLYWLTLFVGLAVALIILLIMPLVEYFFRMENISGYFIVIAATVVVISLGKQYEILLQKGLRFKQSSIIESISLLIGFVTIIILLNLGYKVGALVWGFFLNSVSKTALLVQYGFKEYRPALHFNMSEIRQYVGFGLFQLGEKNVNFFSERFDHIIIGKILGAGQLGLYSFAFNLIYQPISKVNPIINKISLPVFAKIQDNILEVKNVFFKKLKVLTYVNAAILLGLFAISQTMILYIFGEKWQQSIVLLQLLSIVFLFKSIWNPMGSVLLALGKASVGFYWNILLVIVTVPIVLFSSISGDVTYVGFCLIGGQLLMFVPNYYLLVRPALGNCFMELINALAKPLLISGIMCGSVYYIGDVLKAHNFSPLLVLIFQILSGIILQPVLMYIFDKKAVLEIYSFLKLKDTSN